MNGYTFDAMVAALQAWPKNSNSEYTGNINRMIQNAELRLMRDLPSEIFQTTVSNETVTPGNSTFSKPANMLAEIAVVARTSTSARALVKKPMKFCMAYPRDPGTPQFYGDQSDTLFAIFPSPLVAVTMEVRHTVRPTSLTGVAGNAMTYYSRNYGDMLFIASLMDAEQFLKADDRYADMKARYYDELLPKALVEMNSSAMLSRASRSSGGA